LSDESFAATTESVPETTRKSRRRKTAHLKLVPETRGLREKMRAKCAEVAAKLDKSVPLSKDDMEIIVRAALDDLGMPEG